MKKRHSEDEIVRILREAETERIPVQTVCERHGIPQRTLYRWRNKYGGMDASAAQRLRALEAENARLRRLVAEQLLVIDALREFGRQRGETAAPVRPDGRRTATA